ncbi:LAETG motif-containing sortase-dependent surface protein [Streptomyces sp. NPDC020858]|uniref:LAETG motif-containing sortase-dependent surface protein n=1 Tax=Streptomyces sp. NPDC020858 TaxID=3365097 RepID=UPI0037BAFBF3
MHKRARTGLVTAAVTTAMFAAGATAAPAHTAEGTPAQKRALVVVIDFKDVHHADADRLKEEARKEYFGGPQSLAGYYTKVSQGAFTYVPAVPEQVVGPYELDLNQKPCDPGAVNKATREALKTAGHVEGEDYDSLSILQPGTGDCKWNGLASMPGPTTWAAVGENGDIGKGLLVHEFGHNQGFGHHSRELCTGGDLARCTTDGYSGKTPMGGGGSGVGFAAPELIGRGWLPGGQAVTVKKSSTFQLGPLYGGKPGGVRALDIPLGKDRLVVEYRHEDPTYRDDDDGALDAAIEGVHAYRVPEGKYNGSRLIDPTEGKGKGHADAITTLTDAAHQVEVKVVEAGGGFATVAVTVDGVPAPAKAGIQPTQHTSTPAPQTPAAQGAPVPENDTDAAAPAAVPSAPVQAAAGHTAKGGTQDLAQTGGSSATPLIAASGTALAALGAACVYVTRHRGRGRRRA